MKITFVTFHNWETKRHGGFHKFAEACSKAGHKTMFFSFARPYFIALKHDERLNGEVLRKLSKGITYQIDDNGTEIINFTWPTLRIPQPFYRFLPNRINKWFELHSFTPFSKIQKTYLQDTDVFVFESCEAIHLIDKIKKFNPDSKIVYRPSDPMMIDGCQQHIVEDEMYMLRNADKTFIVNKAGLNLYRKRIPDFDKTIKYEILPNGVTTFQYEKKYPTPEILQRANTFLYVGARVIEWNLIKTAAIARPDYIFVIVCPENAPEGFSDVPNNNIVYINGISPNDVPAWVTNADVVIVPNPKGWYKFKPWGITAKYYQAMAAHKPIVSFEDTDELSDYGVFVSHDYDSFIQSLDSALKTYTIDYQFSGLDWETVTLHFLKSIKAL